MKFNLLVYSGTSFETPPIGLLMVVSDKGEVITTFLSSHKTLPLRPTKPVLVKRWFLRAWLEYLWFFKWGTTAYCGPNGVHVANGFTVHSSYPHTVGVGL